ncbi:MAG: ribosomal-processing cysteine protease Prp [Clostridia bacterium]|nr:ribosomal-processing cysteine protease Prp [Clostridia bacterium]
MIRVVFFRNGKELKGFKISGHATSHAEDEQGRIICSAVSSAAYMAANTITEIESATADISVDDGDMQLIINEGYSSGCATVLEGLRLHLAELAKQYNGYMTIKTEAN